MLTYLFRITLATSRRLAVRCCSGWTAARIWLLFVVLVVWTYDTMAYVTGRLFPRGHFFDHISPNKTWSGNIGGLVGAVVVGLLLGCVHRAADRGTGARCAGRPDRAVRRSGRVDGQARRRRQGLEPALPRPRRAARPHGHVPRRCAGRVDVARLLALPTERTRVCVLGSTGSIGTQALDVLAATPTASRSSPWRPGATPTVSPSRSQFGRAHVLAARPAHPRSRTWRRDRRRPGAGRHRRHGQPAAGRCGARCGQGRRNRQQGDARGRRPPGHAAGRQLAGEGNSRWPGCGRSTRSTRRSGNAWPANRCRRSGGWY